MFIQNTVFWMAPIKSKNMLPRVKELGMDSAAITDHGVMYGVIDFYRAAREAGINPILGCEVYVAPGPVLTEKPEAVMTVIIIWYFLQRITRVQ